MHPHPATQPNLTRKFPLSDMPTGLLAALVTPLADHLLIRRSFDEFAVLEPRAGADQEDQVGRVHGSPAVLGGFDELKAIATPAAREPGPLVTRCRSRTVAKVDSMGFVVRRCSQCSAG